jgi:hypothetical protein
MAVMMVVTLERVEKRPGATPATFLPPIFTRTTSVYVFLGQDERQEMNMDDGGGSRPI